jgi:hypothetical protein
MFDPDIVGSSNKVQKAPTEVPVAPAAPPIIINMPSMPEMSMNHLRRYSPLPPSSDGIEPADGEWPALGEFLAHCAQKDRHHRDFGSYEIGLTTNDLLGPDDIAACSTADLERCGVPLGAAIFMITEAQSVKKKVKAEVKRRRITY